MKEVCCEFDHLKYVESNALFVCTMHRSFLCLIELKLVFVDTCLLIYLVNSVAISDCIVSFVTDINCPNAQMLNEGTSHCLSSCCLLACSAAVRVLIDSRQSPVTAERCKAADIKSKNSQCNE